MSGTDPFSNACSGALFCCVFSVIWHPRRHGDPPNGVSDFPRSGPKSTPGPMGGHCPANQSQRAPRVPIMVPEWCPRVPEWYPKWSLVTGPGHVTGAPLPSLSSGTKKHIRPKHIGFFDIAKLITFRSDAAIARLAVAQFRPLTPRSGR